MFAAATPNLVYLQAGLHYPIEASNCPPSSVVERQTFNLVVVGSIPTVGTPSKGSVYSDSSKRWCGKRADDPRKVLLFCHSSETVSDGTIPVSDHLMIPHGVYKQSSRMHRDGAEMWTTISNVIR